MSEPLKPCPMCAAKALAEAEQDWHWCQCSNCGTRAGFASTERAAVAAWNRRAPLPVVTREELARLIDPEAFGLPSIVNNLGEDYLTDRDEASAKADAILSLLRAKEAEG